MTLFAQVYFTKEVEDDNYFEGCKGNIRLMYTDKLSFEFKNTKDLVDKFAQHLAMFWGIDIDDVRECMNNDCDNMRFDFVQQEDEDGNVTCLTEQFPNGYYANYIFSIDYVSQVIEYEFDEIRQ